jgi:hypothetical protein
MTILLPALLAFACMFLLYHFAIRRVLIDLVRFRIFAFRDELRRMAMDGNIKPTSFAFTHLERSLCNLVTIAPHMNMYLFAQFSFWQHAISTPSRQLRFNEVAPAQLKRLEKKALQALFWVLIINSPLGAILCAVAAAWVIIGIHIGFLARRWVAAQRARLERKGRALLDRDLEDCSPRLVRIPV